MKRMIVYGAGNRGRSLCEMLSRSTEYEVVCVVDGDSGKHGQLCGEYVIEVPETIKKHLDVSICISIQSAKIGQDVRAYLQELGYNFALEICYETLLWELFEHNMGLCDMAEHDGPRKLIFSSYLGLGLGGAEAWVRDVSQGLLARGYNNVRILSDQREYKLPEALARITDKIERANTETEDVFENFRNLVEYFAGQLPCIIVVNRPSVEMMAACTVKKKYPDKVRIVCIIHNGTADFYRKNAIFEKYVNVYIGVSEDIRLGMLELGIPEDRIKVMHCPFLCRRVLDRTYADDGYPIRMGYAGRMDSIGSSVKRMDLFLKLIEVLIDKGINFRMEFAGDGPARTYMEKYICQRGWQDKVFCLGMLSRDKMGEFWGRQDICLNLSDYEGRCISILEAMGNGVVPVVTLTSGIREDITDGENGYYVPLGDCKAAAERIQYLAAHRDRLPFMGRLAHDRIYPKSLLEPHLDFWESIIDMMH